MVCGNARVENSELNFMEPSPEMVPHVASDTILCFSCFVKPQEQNADVF